MRTLRSCISPVLALSLLMLALASPASAQYFGRNKVKWDSFRFTVLQTKHFDIHYYGDQKAVAEDVGRMAERWYARYSKFFGHEFEHKPIVLYADAPDFQQTTTTGGLIGEGTGGFTDAYQNRIVMPLTSSYADTDHVLGHEMVHVFQYDIAFKSSKPQSDRTRNIRLMELPLWMIEGLAEYLSQGRHDTQTAMWLRDAAIHDRLPDIEKLTTDPRFSPYQYGQAFWAYIGGRWGDQTVRELFLAAGDAGVAEAFQRVLNMPAKTVFADWQKSAKELYDPVAKSRTLPSALGAALIPTRKGGTTVDLAPSISPDGNWVAFLSARGLIGIDLFLADARTGEVVHQLAGSRSDPHFESLRFIDSAGAWSPDGRQLAFVVFQSGDNRLAILDIDSRKVTKRIKIPGVGAITSPAWSPDGTQIAFSGSSGGVTDLYLIDVSTERVTRLTSDRYGDLQPAWSPDSKEIAFSSDRGPATDLTALKYGPPQISIIDVATKAVRTLTLFDLARHINPQYAPDGKRIFFIADPEGIPDIFAYRFGTGEITRLTHVATGVCGVIDQSPAMSVASRDGRMVYSLFDDGGWRIQALEPATVPVDVVSLDVAVDPPASLLPPQSTAGDADVAQYLAAPQNGLLSPELAGFTTKSYDRSLHLDYVGPPTLGVGVDRYGVGVGGSVSLGFGDILGTQHVGLLIQGGGSTSNVGALFGGQAYYLNEATRVQWGGYLTHLPYTSRYTVTAGGTVVVDGQPVEALIVDDYEETQTVDEAAVFTQYPLSITRRVELTGGFTRIGYDTRGTRYIYVNNQLFDQSGLDLASPPNLSYVRGAAAFVGDNSFYGFASPIAGVRYRLEVATNSGDLKFQTALADYRRYFFSKPFTLAFRGIAYGRYGSGAEDRQIAPLDIGDETLVRGYASLSYSECTTTIDPQSCPELNRLLGSKMSVLNVELRMPLLGTKDFGFFNAPALPTELAAFFDIGGAWTENEKLDVRWARDTTDRVPVASAGIAARVVLGGVIPLEFYWAYPFQRPQESGGVYGFLIVPGW